MATIQERPFSKDYSGLINQSVIAVGIFVLAISSHEYMRRKRRGRGYRANEGLGSVESWQFGYLYQGRSWAKNPSPPLPLGWPLSWVRQVLSFPEDRFNELRGVDASVYNKFLKGCFWFTLAHTVTTLPILFPIHLEFSEDSVSRKSMTRASISSLVGTAKGLSLLWIHMVLLIWVTLSWMGTLYWIARGAFRFRSQKIQEIADRVAQTEAKKEAQYYPHPHPQYPFQDIPPMDEDNTTRGICLRTVMVTNIPPNLRTDKDLKEYFEYYLSRRIAKPSMGVTSTTQPGFLNRTFAFLFNRARHLPGRLQKSLVTQPLSPEVDQQGDSKVTEIPVIDRVVLVRKMSDLASLLERREDVLRLLETAHIKLARKAIAAVQEAAESKPSSGFLQSTTARLSFAHRRSQAPTPDIENGRESAEGTIEGEDRMQLLIRTLGPYIPSVVSKKHRFGTRLKWGLLSPGDLDADMKSPITIATSTSIVESHLPHTDKTIWDALLSLPRSALDSYQPLIHLSALFRGKTVPSIDYYTTKLNILTSLITEKRAKAVNEYTPTSTAFVTFKDPVDARRACQYLAVHPNNPLDACLVTMAPSYEDLDWTRLMKAAFKVEFVKDWVVNIGVWGFTIFWVFPVSIFVGLVSIQNISAFWPGLQRYLDKHEWEAELIQSFLPTLLVALLALLIPLLLLLIAKKAHTISTLSMLHDRIMTRYYKFLIVNVLVFFCIGTVALQSFLVSFSQTTGLKLIQVVSDSFPSAGPFYVGWLIFTMGMHGGFELALFGLPLIVYPSTKRQVTPRKRDVGIRPRTFNYYYWLPNHLLVIHILLVFSVLNPLVTPFGFIYFCVESTVVKNQLLHVYAKNYEGNGKFLLIRMIRYSLDGLILSQVVFLAYMVVLKKTANVVVSAILVVFTACVKMLLTRVCRAQYERDDILEADIICGTTSPSPNGEMADLCDVPDALLQSKASKRFRDNFSAKTDFWTLKLANRMSFIHGSRAKAHINRRHPNPFQPRSSESSTVPMHAFSSTAGLIQGPSSPSESTPPPLPDIVHPRPIQEDEEGDDSAVPERPALVSPHAPHPAWDDNPSYDRPYENPYYTRPISNFLWLPRDPLGLLDLDDTVDLRMALTSEPGAGKLGTWDDDGFIGSSISSVLMGSFGDLDEDDDLSHTPPMRTLDGSEVISLPSAIASRVENIDQESDVEHTSQQRRPSLLGPRRTSSSTSTNPSLGLRRPTALDVGSHQAGFRSFSLGVDSMGTAGRTPSSNTTSSSDPRRRNRAATLDNGVGLRPHRQYSSGHATRSLLSVVESPIIPVPRALTSDGTPSIISTREAVVGEVIMEEKDLTQEFRRLEEEEKQKAEGSRSWWTSWLYARHQ